MLKKVLAIMLAIFMIAGVLSITVFAEDGNEPETSPIEIYTIEDLYAINYNLGGNYILMNDIDMTEATAEGGVWDYLSNGWEPIGSNGLYSGDTPFTGTFDGNGHEIIGMRIRVKTLPAGTNHSIFAGLFAKNTGTIKNLIVSGNISGQYRYYYGAIAGYNGGTIQACVANADVNVTAANGDVYAGGVAGFTSDVGTVTECVNNGDITANYSSYYDNDGFAVSSGISMCQSYLRDAGTISNCYNTGTISASNSNDSTHAYSAGISADRYRASYALITTSNCYNIGLADYAISERPVTNCYFLKNIGQGVSGAKSLTEGQMKLKVVFGGFDFDNVWYIDSNAEYPYPQLRCFAQEPFIKPAEEPTDEPTEPPTEVKIVYVLGDIDGDQEATVVDATYIQRYNADIFVPFAVGEPVDLG